MTDRPSARGLGPTGEPCIPLRAAACSIGSRLRCSGARLAWHGPRLGLARTVDSRPRIRPRLCHPRQDWTTVVQASLAASIHRSVPWVGHAVPLPGRVLVHAQPRRQQGPQRRSLRAPAQAYRTRRADWRVRPRLPRRPAADHSQPPVLDLPWYCGTEPAAHAASTMQHATRALL